MNESHLELCLAHDKDTQCELIISVYVGNLFTFLLMGLHFYVLPLQTILQLWDLTEQDDSTILDFVGYSLQLKVSLYTLILSRFTS